ncbi:elements of external origin [Aquabacterium sp. A7-Y]|uniref:elements of external origin n=1 Tax=Aquabacterium sp. A7-Y TaxID=1349605 RepID=UPI00223CC4F2|nr:elements of external origin [Aquabacterium sp. A7-Y]MCW7542095.1 elements of external origin [Aquabacterium sp. A7-Y]
MGISLRAYARHRGVSDTAVRKAVLAGRITPEPDGTINAERADAEWTQNTEAPKVGTRQKAPQVQSDLVERGTSPSGGTSLLQARTVNEVVKAQANKVRLARLKGELVDRSQALAHVFKLARAERDAWLNWPGRVSSELAARLGVDPHELHVALETAVREQLQELGEVAPRVDG